MHKLLLASAAFALLAIQSSTPAMAFQDSPLCRAACEYRDAVHGFHAEVIRSQLFGPYEHRVLGYLEECAGGIWNASQNPDHHFRLPGRWREIQYLQPRIETILFGRAGCPINGALYGGWARMEFAYAAFSRELALIETALLVPSYGAYRVPVPGCSLSGYPYGLANPVLPGQPVTPTQPFAPGDPALAPAPGQPAPSVPSYPSDPGTVVPSGPANQAPGYQPPPVPDPVPPNAGFNRPTQTLPSRFAPRSRFDDSDYWNASYDPYDRHRVIARPSLSSEWLRTAEPQAYRVPSRRSVGSAAIGALLSRLIE